MYKMNTDKTRKLVKTAMIAALYATLTIAVAPLSFGMVQFRFSEVLILLCFLDKEYASGLVLGCLLANFFSPMWVADIIFGTLATYLSTVMIIRSKNLLIASLWPTFFCIIVAIELHLLLGMPLIIGTLSVMIGEFAVVTLLGYPIFNMILKNKKLVCVLRFESL